MNKKLIDLEEKLIFLEHTTEELNNVIFRQRRELDEYKVMLKHLSNKLKNLEDNQSNTSAEVVNEKPPHY